MAPFDGSAWDEEDDEIAPPPEVPYYNNFPGKQPPPGGIIDMRTRSGATLVRRHPLMHTTQHIRIQRGLQHRDDKPGRKIQICHLHI